MKTKLILIILLSIVLFSCKEATIDNSVKNPKGFTTVKLQELPKDTIVISIVEDDLFVFNKENNIIIRSKVIGGNVVGTYTEGFITYIVILHIITFILLLVLIVNLD